MSIRVRFAPSPTGHIHVGNARTALFNYLFAKKNNGVFILRIEDTDLERSTLESENIIYEDLKWLGLDWDEGPIVGGDFGPYRQSERLHIYDEYVKKLISEGFAYECFCSKDELEAEREKAKTEGRQPIYNGKCRNLISEEKIRLKNSGIKPSIRFHVKEKEVLVKDFIKGDVLFPTDTFGDFVIVRPDGIPTYNFAVVIDDALMHITHVIRGDDHLNNTPKQILIYNALNFKLPIFVHIPMILGSDHSKLSKRHGDTSLNLFKDKGYLPEAMFNFLALLSWSAPDDKEIMGKEEIISLFTLDRISKSSAVFDFAKLKWMNGHYIRTLDKDRLFSEAIPFLEKAGLMTEDFKNKYKVNIPDMIFSLREKFEIFTELPDLFKVYTEFNENLDGEAVELLKLPTSKAVLEAFRDAILGKTYITAEEYKRITAEIQKSVGVKGKALFMVLRVGVTGLTKGADLDKIVTLLSVEDLIQRLDKALKIMSQIC
ncbi:glutamate--tRNA ligase [Calditerrivibrio sp.]|uniref:glutamate--tRNA ligase n=1 Tax=Calditerrivibrio sp. TaxID=2792612 RepID=UPI003D0D16D8